MVTNNTPLTAAELAGLCNGAAITVTVERLLCTVLNQAEALAVYERTSDQTIAKLEETTAALSAVFGKLSNVRPAIVLAARNERMRCLAMVNRLEPKAETSAEWRAGFNEGTLNACAAIMARALNAAAE